MPVLITVPASPVGRAVVSRIAAVGGQVRAFCDPTDPVTELRQLGAICAVGSLLDEGRLESAMEQVHTVVHLALDPMVGDPELVVEETATVVSAAVGARVRRMVVVSLPGAAATAADPPRRAAADVEETVRATPFPSVVIRPSLVDTPTLRHALARTPLGPQALDNPVAPIGADDLGALIYAVDEARSELEEGHLVLAADGATTVPLRTYLQRVGITPMSAFGRVVERFRAVGAGEQLAAALSGPMTSGADALDGWAAFGLEPPRTTSGA